ncbi:hypothetical protein GPECTOR_35g909 [Gonium pectorale]|uniref:C2H2-type domain-containing protein n=1 Tax=Gonium pectorale TaxID=33097 RepID=A0A150GC90_GONPE|nr:hypothetical protein GPECTOR_35g909 [Gonium pectorale]|eukprot:KXZ47471.1 hypothetical protein GPECTOR_35g909 [Gonium pectorale]
MDQSFFRMATECAGVLKDFCRGGRAKAKRALQRLSQEHPNSFLPHRYLASELAPGSLSSAALRATLLVNLLVEESALQGGLALSQEQPPQPPEQAQSGEAAGSSTAADSGDVAWYQLQPEARCEAIKREFREAIAHCVRTLECTSPLLVEPVITISDAHARTCDPCCLRVQDSIVEWVKQDNWQRIVAEKRSVLACMHQVLESCHTLLDSTHIPVDGIVRLLQHILRPHQQDLQLWASQLLLSKGSVDDLQHKFETQAAVTELLRMLRPGRQGEEALASAAGGVVQAGLGPTPQQGKTQAVPTGAHSHAAAGPSAGTMTPPPQPHPPQQHRPQANPVDGAVQGRSAAVPPLPPPAPPPPPQQELAPRLSAEQEWDEVRDGASAPTGSNAANAGGAGGRRAGGKAKNRAKGGDVARGPRKERSRYERYMDVETFWRTTSPEQRRQLLKVPMAALLKGVRREQGNDAVDELIEGLVLLREQGNRAACYWLCPVCEQKFHSSRDFLGHVELVHEGLAVQDNKYVCCYKCQQDVVGMYYTSTRTPGYNLCFRCYAADAATMSSSEAFEKVFMRPSAGGRTWSHSDFMSTRDSFSSLSERSHRHHQQQALPGQKQHAGGHGGAPAGGHVHGSSCRHHPHCPHHSHGHAHGQSPYGLENSSAHPVLTFGEASDEWLAPLPTGTLSAPATMPDPRAPLPVPSGPTTATAPHTTVGRPRTKRSSGGSSCNSSDSVLGQSLHSRSLSEPPNPGRTQQGDGAGPEAAAEGAPDGGGGSSAIWRSWWPTRLMQGWAAKGQPQQQGPGQPQPPGGGSYGQAAGAGPPHEAADEPNGSQSGDGGDATADDEGGDFEPSQGAAGTPIRGARGAGEASGAVDAFASGMNGMVAELMTRLREIYLTDRDLGDMSLGSITQFVYRTLGAGAAADDLHLASCPPGPRAVLLEFLAQPSIVFQRPQALAVVLGLLPLADLQKVAAYAVQQHEEAVSGAEAAARDIAAGSDEELGPEDDDEDGTGAGSDSEDFHMQHAAAREVAAATAVEAAVASHLQAPMPRARRRLRYTSRRAPGGSSQGQQAASSQYGAAPPGSYHGSGGAPPLPPHAGGAHTVGDSHALNLQCTEHEGSAEEVSEEEMESAGDGLDYALGPDGEPLPLRAVSPPQYASTSSAPRAAQHQQQLQQLRHAVAGDVELGFDRLITQMWGGGGESDDPAAGQLEQQSAPPSLPTAGSCGAATGGGGANSRNRGQQQGNRSGAQGGGNGAGRNAPQGRQQSPTARGGAAGSAVTVAGLGAAGPGGAAVAAAASDDPLLAEELAGPREDEPYLLVADWWLQHLRLDGSAHGPDEMRVLRWVYGNIINVQAEEFCARQRELRGGRERDAAILELYDEVAAVWRSLQAVTDKRSRLEALRRAARGHFAVVKRLEEAGGHATLEQATEFLDAVLSGYCQGQQGAAAAPGGVAHGAAPAPSAAASDSADPAGSAAAPPEQPSTPTASEALAPVDGAAAGASGAAGDGGAVAPPAAGAAPSGPLLYLCERAVEVVRRHPALAQEPSQRYAAALLERELSVLALVEVMVAAEAEEAVRERGVAEESLKRHRAEHREAEAEYQRVQAEGPASHRKKDLLDKATKEAEHREQLRELAARLASLSDSIAADEASKAKWADKQEEAERELAYVRDAIRQTSARRASLLDVCATLDVPFVPPQPHQQPRQQQPGQQAQQQARAARPPGTGEAAAADPAGAGEPDDGAAALSLGVPSGTGGQAIATTDMEWRATRLECLMYRVLWVSEAVKMFQPQYSPRQSTHHYDLFIRATHWAKQLSEEYEESIRAYCCELERLRARLRDVAAVDLGYEIGASALEVVRRRVESAARAAREAASLTLLKELEEEEERRKAAEAAAKEAKEAIASGASGSKKASANKKAAKASQDNKSRTQKEKERELAKQAEEEARRRAEEEDKERVAAARRAREAALEAELERRRRELEELEAQREAEAIRAAQEASLREQQLREQREREQRERAEAAAAAAAQARALQQEQQAQAQQQSPAAAAAGAAAGRGTQPAAQASARKAEAAVQQPAQAQQQVRRAPGAAAESTPEKQQPKRNAARRGNVASEKSPGSPEAPVASAAAVVSANGTPPAAAGRAAPAAKSGTAAAAAGSGSAVSSPATAAAQSQLKQRQGSGTVPASPGVGSPGAPDAAAAAAVAAATAGIVKAAQGAAPSRSSPAKQGLGGSGASPPAGGNVARRPQQPVSQQPQPVPGMAAPAPGRTAGPPGTAAASGNASPPGAPPPWNAPPVAAPPPMLPPGVSPSAQQVPQRLQQTMSLEAAQGARVHSPPMAAGPMSPGSDFPPLSAANALSAPLPPQQARPQVAAPPPPMAMPMPPPQQQPQQQQQQPMLGFSAQQAQAHAQAHAFAEAQARLIALAQMPPPTGKAAIPPSVVAPPPQQSPMLPPGEMPVLPSEHLHAHLRQQQLHQTVQQHFRQQLQQQHQLMQQHQHMLHQQLMQSSPRPGVAGMGAPVFDPFAENPLLKALSAMEAKASPLPASPGAMPGPSPPALSVTAPPGAMPPPQGTQSLQGPPAGSLVRGHGHMAPVDALPDPLLGGMHTSQGGVAGGPGPEADTHIMSIMSILDHDGQSSGTGPGNGSGGSGAGQVQPASASASGARSSPSASTSGPSGQASQATTAASSPQRGVLPSSLPPGPPTPMYGNTFGAPGGPPLLPSHSDGSPGATGSPAAASAQQAQASLLPNGFGPGAGVPSGAVGVHGSAQGSDALSGGGSGTPQAGLAGLSGNGAFGSGIWRPGGSGSQLPMGVLGLGLGLSGIGAVSNTWATGGLPQAGAGGGATGPRPGRPEAGAASATPRQGTGVGDWGAPLGNAPPGSAAGPGAGPSRRDSSVTLPESVDSLVASLPTTLLPSSLDADSPPPPSPPSASASGLAPTAAPFYPASLRGKLGPSASGAASQQHVGMAAGAMGAMGAGPMGLGAIAGDGAAAWIGGMAPSKQGAAAAAAMAAAAGNGVVPPPQMGGPAGMAGLAGAVGPGSMRFGMGLYNGDGVNWSHGGMVHAPGGVMQAPGVPVALRATSTTWAPFVPPAMGSAGVVQQATQQQQQQQAQQSAGWPRGQRWRN